MIVALRAVGPGFRTSAMYQQTSLPGAKVAGAVSSENKNANDYPLPFCWTRNLHVERVREFALERVVSNCALIMAMIAIPASNSINVNP